MRNEKYKTPSVMVVRTGLGHALRATLFFICHFSFFICTTACRDQPEGPVVFVPSRADSLFLDSLERDHFQYFWSLAHPVTGLHPDRYPSTRNFCSIAAVGFGLSAYIVGAERGYVPRADAARRTNQVLRFLLRLPQNTDSLRSSGYRGFFYHFITQEEGLRYNSNIELSSVDTGLLLMGVLSAQTYYDNPRDSTEVSIRALADSLYRRVQWDWMIARPPLLSMGWRPEHGFLDSDWVGYNEAMFLYVLALASPTYPITPDSWTAWTSTYRWGRFYGSAPHVNFSPLFGHQYSHVWIDFRGIQDEYMRNKGMDYFENSRRATYANYLYCLNNPEGFQGYGADFWGLTASDGPADGLFRGENGRLRRFWTYRARGASLVELVDDGTIAPTAAGGAIPFAPELCIPLLRNLKQRFGPQFYTRLGFRDAVNLSFPTGNGQPWINLDYLGIDQGPICLMTANYKDELIWNLMKRNPYIRTGLQRAGFTGGWLRDSTLAVQSSTLHFK